MTDSTLAGNSPGQNPKGGNVKKTIPNDEKKKKPGRVLGRKLAREVSVDELRSAAGGIFTMPGDTSHPIKGPDSD